MVVKKNKRQKTLEQYSDWLSGKEGGAGKRQVGQDVGEIRVEWESSKHHLTNSAILDRSEKSDSLHKVEDSKLYDSQEILKSISTNWQTTEEAYCTEKNKLIRIYNQLLKVKEQQLEIVGSLESKILYRLEIARKADLHMKDIQLVLWPDFAYSGGQFL